MVKSIKHVGFSVKNLEESIYFYCNILGFRETEKQLMSGDYLDEILNEKSVDLEVVFLEAENQSTVIELLNIKSPENKIGDNVPFFQTGLNHISIEVDNIDSIYTQLKAEGYKTNSKPLISPDKQVKICFVREPNGILLELIEMIS